MVPAPGGSQQEARLRLQLLDPLLLPHHPARPPHVVDRRSISSKPLLYHYFPSKQDYFRATLADAAEELRRRTDPDPEQPPLVQLDQALEGFLGWIEENSAGYLKLIESAASIPDVRALVDDVRMRTVEWILRGLFADTLPPPRVRAAALGWLWFMDGAIQDWLRHGDFDRAELKRLLMGALAGALTAAGAGERAAAVAR